MPREHLDARSLAVLELERDWWREPGTKAELIQKRLHMSPTRYYRLLDRLIDSPIALRHDPLLVKRLRRTRTARRRQRFEGSGRERRRRRDG